MPQGHTIYRHTQFGAMTAAACATGLLLLGWRGFAKGWDPVLLLVTAVLLACLLLFHSLTVTVDRRHVRLRFGLGPIVRRFDLKDVLGVSKVRSKWWHGYGIRWIPGGVLYSVSGLDAVELRLRNGRIVRVGTDDPQGLFVCLRALLQE